MEYTIEDAKHDLVYLRGLGKSHYQVNRLLAYIESLQAENERLHRDYVEPQRTYYDAVAEHREAVAERDTYKAMAEWLAERCSWSIGGSRWSALGPVQGSPKKSQEDWLQAAREAVSAPQGQDAANLSASGGE